MAATRGIRETWGIDSKVEIFSKRFSQWLPGNIRGILHDSLGEWLNVIYKINNEIMLRSVQRYSDQIRPVSYESNTKNIDPNVPIKTTSKNDGLYYLADNEDTNDAIDEENDDELYGRFNKIKIHTNKQKKKFPNENSELESNSILLWKLNERELQKLKILQDMDRLDGPMHIFGLIPVIVGIEYKNGLYNIVFRFKDIGSIKAINVSYKCTINIDDKKEFYRRNATRVTASFLNVCGCPNIIDKHSISVQGIKNFSVKIVFNILDLLDMNDNIINYYFWENYLSNDGLNTNKISWKVNSNVFESKAPKYIKSEPIMIGDIPFHIRIHGHGYKKIGKPIYIDVELICDFKQKRFNKIELFYYINIVPIGYYIYGSEIFNGFPDKRTVFSFYVNDIDSLNDISNIDIILKMDKANRVQLYDLKELSDMVVNIQDTLNRSRSIETYKSQYLSEKFYQIICLLADNNNTNYNQNWVNREHIKTLANKLYSYQKLCIDNDILQVLLPLKLCIYHDKFIEQEIISKTDCISAVLINSPQLAQIGMTNDEKQRLIQYVCPRDIVPYVDIPSNESTPINLPDNQETGYINDDEKESISKDSKQSDAFVFETPVPVPLLNYDIKPIILDINSCSINTNDVTPNNSKLLHLPTLPIGAQNIPLIENISFTSFKEDQSDSSRDDIKDDIKEINHDTKDNGYVHTPIPLNIISSKGVSFRKQGGILEAVNEFDGSIQNDDIDIELKDDIIGDVKCKHSLHTTLSTEISLTHGHPSGKLSLHSIPEIDSKSDNEVMKIKSDDSIAFDMNNNSFDDDSKAITIDFIRNDSDTSSIGNQTFVTV